MIGLTRIITAHSLVLPHTPEEVWVALSTLGDYPTWWPRRFPVRVIKSTPGLLYSVIRVRPFLGSTFHCRFEEVQEAQSMRIRLFNGRLEGPCFVVLARTAGGTEVSLNVDVYIRSPWARILSLIISPKHIHGLQARRLLRALKKRVRVLAKRQPKTQPKTQPKATSVTITSPIESPTPSQLLQDAPPNLENARRYLATLSSAASPEEIDSHFSRDAIGEEFGNPFLLGGAIRDSKELVAALLRFQKEWTSQVFELRGATCGPTQLALEILWTGTSARRTEHFSEGQTSEARLAMFLKLDNGKIVRQRTYRSLDPLTAGPQEDEVKASPPRPATGEAETGANPGALERNFDLARRYLDALSEGQTADEIARFFSTDAVQEVLPSLLCPDGARRNLQAIRVAREKSLFHFPTELHDLRGALGASSSLALEVEWTAVAAVDRSPFVQGQEVVVRSAVFLEFVEGLIIHQRNYDCVQPAAPVS